MKENFKKPLKENSETNKSGKKSIPSTNSTWIEKKLKKEEITKTNDYPHHPNHLIYYQFKQQHNHQEKNSKQKQL